MPPNDQRPAKPAPRPRTGATGELRAPSKQITAPTGETRAPSKQITAPTGGGAAPAKAPPARAATRPGVTPAPGKTPTPSASGKTPPPRAPARPPAPLGPGSVIDGRYRLDQVLGSGGMSTVYRGTHVRTGGSLAIKLLDPRLSGKADMQQRCLQEARAMMDISSNHVVRAYDVGETPTGQVYIAMEYLEGEDLDRMLQREGPIAWARIAGMGIQICSGLASAHNKGTFHRDIKPQNCFRVTLDRNPDHIKLIDFGIAKDTNSNQELTQDGVLLGTPEYMAPELIATNAVPDARSDIYAVGATLYKLLTGGTPFASKNVLDLLYHQKHTAAEPPSKRAPDRQIPPIADKILLRALEKDPDKRYQTAEEMAQAILESFDAASAGVARHLSQPFLPAIGERSRPGTTPISTPAPPPTPSASPPSGATPLGTPTLDEAEGSTVASEPAVRDEVSKSQQYDTDAPRPVSLKDVGMRAGTLVSLALVFGLASWVAAPSPSATELEAAAAEPADAPTAPEGPPPEGPALNTPDSPDSPPIEPPKPDEPAPAAETGAPAVPGDTKSDDPPVPPDTKVEDPPSPPDTKAEDPPAPPDTKADKPVPEDTKAAAPAPTPAPGPEGAAEPDPDFNYRSAEKELRSQHKFLQTCLDDAGQTGGKLKFAIEVRKSGMPPHRIKVFSSSDAVRACVRGLFEQFPFDPSPRGGAFSYNYNGGRATFERLPLSTPSTPTK